MFKKKENNRIISIYKAVELEMISDSDTALDYDVVSLAKQAARKNEPPTNSLHGDSNEKAFKNKLQAVATQAFQRVDEALSHLSNSLSSSSISKESRVIENLASHFERATSSKLTPVLSNIDDAKKNYVEAEDDLQLFKKENKIRRQAFYPESNLLSIGFLAIALIIESVLNGTMLAAGSDGGLIGGVFIAFGISFLNLAFGFINGWLVIRYKNHITTLKSSAGLLFGILFFFILLVFNLFIAHYRDALVSNPVDAGRLGVESFISGILSINSVESWLLVGLGLCFMIIATYKGYKFDDEYPGYGSRARCKGDAKEEVSNLKNDAIDELEELHNDCLGELDDNYKKALKVHQSIIGYISSFEQQKSLLESYIEHLQGTYLYIMRLYYDTNSAERSSPAPDFFQKEVESTLNIRKSQVLYIDNREDTAKQIEALTSLEPKVKMMMQDVTNMYHKKIMEAGLL